MPYRVSLKQAVLENERTILKWTAAAIVAVTFGALAYVRFFTSAGDVEDLEEAQQASAEASRVLTATVIERLSAAYRELGAEGASEGARLAWIEQKQQQSSALNRTLPARLFAAATARSAWLENERRTLLARAAARGSEELAEKAAAAGREGSEARQLELLREALERRREANRLKTTDAPADFERERALLYEVSHREVGAVERKIVAILDDPAATAAELSSALKEQTAINDRFLGTTLVNVQRVALLEQRVATVQSNSLSLASDEAEARAARALAQRDVAAAGRALLEAQRFQQTLNERFPVSGHASEARVDRLRRQREEVLAGAELARVEEIDRSVAAQLRRGEVAAALVTITEGLALLARTMRDYPLAAASRGPAQMRLEFLAQLRSDLDRLRASILDNLAPLPSAAAGRRLMLRTEVTQSLYQRIMNENPSRNVDVRLPVDSVTWEEAALFCQRVSWLLGWRARLPRQEEFLEVAAGSRWSRSQANSDGHSWPTEAPKGEFGDILGNVDELLEPPQGALDWTQAVGGSYLDSEVPPQATLRKIARKERSRATGFRIVVELDQPADNGSGPPPPTARSNP